MGKILENIGITENSVKEFVKRIILNEQELDMAITMILSRNKKHIKTITDEYNYIAKYANAFTIKWNKNNLTPIKVSIEELNAPNTSLYTVAKLTFTVGRNAINKITDTIKESDMEEIINSVEEFVKLSETNSPELKRKLKFVIKYSLALQYIYYRIYNSFMYSKNNIYKELNIGFPKKLKGMELRRSIFLSAVEITYILADLDKEVD